VPHFRILITAGMVALAACGTDRGRGSHVPVGPLARVLIDSSGGIELNAHSISLTALADSLRLLEFHGGAVVYSRAPAAAEPTAAQSAIVKQVLSAVTDIGLPIRLVRPDSLMLPDSVLRK
jgi:hypothetical protein